jgi:hypothetical protein
MTALSADRHVANHYTSTEIHIFRKEALSSNKFNFIGFIFTQVRAYASKILIAILVSFIVSRYNASFLNM